MQIDVRRTENVGTIIEYLSQPFFFSAVVSLPLLYLLILLISVHLVARYDDLDQFVRGNDIVVPRWKREVMFEV